MDDMAAVEGGPVPARPKGIEAFSFGDPEAVLDRRQIMDMLEVWHNSRWYEPPVSMDGLARAYRVSPHHSSAMILKRRLLVASFEPTPWLSRAAFEKAVQDYLVFGNAYLECRYNLLGRPLRLDHALAKYVRRGLEAGRFFFVPGATPETAFKPGSVVHVLQPDVNQEIYGVPEYLSALQSALLNEAATLFRRRYYLNGSHAGYILYATGDFADGDTEAMREALKNSKGPGNFRNLFLHAPAGKQDGIKIHPIAEVGGEGRVRRDQERDTGRCAGGAPGAAAAARHRAGAGIGVRQSDRCDGDVLRAGDRAAPGRVPGRERPAGVRGGAVSRADGRPAGRVMAAARRERGRGE